MNAASWRRQFLNGPASRPRRHCLRLRRVRRRRALKCPAYSGEFTENVHRTSTTSARRGWHARLGFRAAITRTSTPTAEDELYKDLSPSGDDCREGLTAVISLPRARAAIRGPNQDQAGQQRSRASSTRRRRLPRKFLERIRRRPRRSCRRAFAGRRGPRERPQTRQLVRERKGALSGGGLPGNFATAPATRSICAELYLVEGNSAGEALKAADPRYQAILPLRGKGHQRLQIAPTTRCSPTRGSQA